MNHKQAFIGVEGLDNLIMPGLTYDTQIMVHGDTGIGKSVLAAQFIYEGLTVGDTCVYIACDDVPQTMRLTLQSFRLGSKAYEESGQLVFVDAYSRGRSDEELWIPDASVLDEFYHFEKELLEKYASGNTRLIVDSVSTLFYQNEPAAYLGFNSNRLKLLRRMQIFTLDNYVRGVLDERSLFSLAHTYPVIVNMQFQAVEGDMRRALQLGKLKSGEFQAQYMPFTIDPRTGIIVYK